ncbi:MAG: MarR family transcriptional regulator [Spirochaetes bacterium]|nr:MarR family transcriptional regulator [Spirochaetota bacterium]
MSETKGIAADIRLWMETFTVRSMHEWMRHVKAAGLSMPQVGLLMFLHHGESRTVHDVGEHLGISNPAASMLVDRLVRAGLAERTEQPGDRRIRRIRLTAEGRSFVERSLRERDAWVGDLAAHLSREEEAALRRVLPALMEAERRLGAAQAPTPCRTHNAPAGPRTAGPATKRPHARR